MTSDSNKIAAGGEVREGTPTPDDFVMKLHEMWKEERTREEAALFRGGFLLSDAKSHKVQNTIWCALPLLVCEILKLRDKVAGTAKEGEGAEVLRLIEYLRGEQGSDEVEIWGRSTGKPYVTCYGPWCWDHGTHQRVFSGETVLEALRKAAEAKRAAMGGKEKTG